MRQVEEGAGMDADARARFVTALRKLEYSQGRYHAGTLLLAQDPRRPQQVGTPAG